eukprot:TRINITY_DN9754_c0_g1_i1.p1 TRINITY_DN9754_c0_g1~~TRINITY_DN9754_c0_g1_i1.p1  ORF type:complete len:116 (+),score=16.97 TRINITY_DN9754_c0_g1_i1:119-466(+)
MSEDTKTLIKNVGGIISKYSKGIPPKALLIVGYATRDCCDTKEIELILSTLQNLYELEAKKLIPKGQAENFAQTLLSTKLDSKTPALTSSNPISPRKLSRADHAQNTFKLDDDDI